MRVADGGDWQPYTFKACLISRGMIAYFAGCLLLLLVAFTPPRGNGLDAYD